MTYRIEKITKVAEMYYEDNLKQTSISRRLNISKYAVSRMLKKALEVGIVKIEVVKPEEFRRVS